MEGAPMLDTTTFIGLDVHARSIKAVSLDVMTGEVRAATFGYDAGAVAEWVRSVDPRARCVYESGVVSVNLFFTSFAKQARRSRKGGFTGCANVFSPIPVTA